MDTPSRFVAEVDRQLPHPVIDDLAEPRHDILVVPSLILVVSADQSATVGASVAQVTRASLSAVAVRDPAKRCLCRDRLQGPLHEIRATAEIGDGRRELMGTNADIESGDDPRLGPALPAIQIAATDLNVRRRAERQAKLILSVQGSRNERREWQSLLAGAGRNEDIVAIEWVAADSNSRNLLGRVKARLPEKPETADAGRSVAGLSASSLLLALLRPLHFDSDADTPLGQQHVGPPWLIVAAQPVEFGLCVPATGSRRLDNHTLHLTMVFAFRRVRAGAAKPVHEVLRAERGTPEYDLSLTARCAEMPFARILGS